MWVPRLKQSKNEMINRSIIAVISKYMTIRGCVSKEKLMDVLGISRTALYARWNNPDNFRLGELRMVYDFLHVPDEERVGLQTVKE